MGRQDGSDVIPQFPNQKQAGPITCDETCKVLAAVLIATTSPSFERTLSGTVY